MCTWRYAVILVLIGVAISAAACGGDSKTETVPPTPTATVYLSPTPFTVPLPPTWTPRPTVTSPPTPLPANVATATPLPAGAQPATNALPPTLITLDHINQSLAAELASGTGVTFEQPPVLGLDTGSLVTTINLYSTPGDPTSARAVVIEAQIVVTQGRLAVNRTNAYYLADSTPYTGPAVNALLVTFEQKLNLLVAEAYDLRATQINLSSILVTGAGITIKSAERR